MLIGNCDQCQVLLRLEVPQDTAQLIAILTAVRESTNMTAAFSSLLEEALEAWAYARQGVIEEVQNIPQRSFGFRPTPATRTVTEVVQHIIESSLMMSGELTRPDADFTRQAVPRFVKQYAGHVRRSMSKGALLKLLETSHANGEKQFRKAGELNVLQFVRRFDGQQGTRLAWMEHGIAHEEYHRGQLALYARLLGRVPALTQLIHGT